MNIEGIADRVVYNIFGNSLRRDKSFYIYIEEENRLISKIVTNSNKGYVWVVFGTDEEIRKKLLSSNLRTIMEESEWEFDK